jgi:hypothetical protein
MAVHLKNLSKAPGRKRHTTACSTKHQSRQLHSSIKNVEMVCLNVFDVLLRLGNPEVNTFFSRDTYIMKKRNAEMHVRGI